MVEKDVLQEIIQACRQSTEEVTKEDIELLKEQLEVLKQVISQKQEAQNEKSAEYWAKAKLGISYYFKGNMGESHTRALEAITNILDILRGESLMITIQKVQRNSKGEIIGITTYRGKESKLTTRYNTKYKQVEYDLEASLDELEKIEEANKAYIEHYSKFYNLANQHIKSTRSHASSTGWRKKVNEGNIVEAYQRHMQMKHKELGLKAQSYLDDFTAQDILILLYYSVGNTPWWEQGDIGYNQIKVANNTRLASASSIRRVATKILEMFSDYSKFDVNEFNQLFTAHDQDQLTDISELSDNEINNLLNEIKATGRFK